jgi:hypothetical protein
MLKNTKYHLFFAVVLLAVINTMTSCTPSKKVIYFNDLNKDSASGTLGRHKLTLKISYKKMTCYPLQ